MFKRRSGVALAVLAVSAILTTTAAVADMKLHGSSTVTRTIIEPHKAAIERDLGDTLAIVSNGSGNGLKDLVAGRAEVAMISAPLEVEAAIVNGSEAGSLDVTGLQVFPVGSAEIRVIVNKDNGVRALTREQARGLFSGEIRNWSQVGGADLPVIVAAERPGQGTRSALHTALLADKSFAADARLAPALTQVSAMVSQLPGAIGFGNATSIQADKVIIVDGISIPQPLALVTKGAPNAKAEKLIQAARAAGSKS